MFNNTALIAYEFERVIRRVFRSLVVDEFLRFTPITAIKAAAKLPLMVLSKLKELDDPWLVALDRAEQAGKLLARVLLASNDISELNNGEDKTTKKSRVRAFHRQLYSNCLIFSYIIVSVNGL